jgi:putative tricarboxylic transport membrane protein
VSGIEGLLGGFGIALQPVNLLWALLGVTVGTLIGVLPGVGPVSGIALLIPLTYGLNPVSGIILLAGIYYGAMYGGSTTAILAGIPGESSSVMTAVDGYEMTKQGRAGVALGISAFGSFIAGTAGVLLLTLFAPLISRWALKLGPPEFFLLMCLAFSLVAVLTGDSFVKGLISAVLGLLLSTVGIDIFSGEPRFTMDMIGLIDGIEFLVVAIAVFAVADVIENVEKGISPMPVLKHVPLREMMPGWNDWKASVGPILRASGLGFVVGALPGAGATIASFMSYGVEKSLSREPWRFGHGAIEGVAAAESANNAASSGAMVPLITLGIPGSGSTAVLLGAFILFGIRPGPLLFEQHPDVAWGLIASMYLGNLMLLILNLPLIGLFIQVIRLPYPTLSLLVLTLSLLGVFANSASSFGLVLLVFFGACGWILRRAEFPMPPLLLGLVLGGLTEKTFRQAMLMSDDGLLIFVKSPLSTVLTICLGAVFAYGAYQFLRSRMGSGEAAQPGT